MRTITLIRTKKDNKAIRGTLSYQMRNREYEMETFSSPSLENADYLIPAGTYPVESTWSPRFKKFLPLTKGCVLLDLAGMSNITVLFNQLKFEEENAQIEIKDHYAA